MNDLQGMGYDAMGTMMAAPVGQGAGGAMRPSDLDDDGKKRRMALAAMLRGQGSVRGGSPLSSAMNGLMGGVGSGMMIRGARK